MHHLLFIQLLSEKTESGFRQIYDEYAKRLYSFTFSVVENKVKAEDIISKTFTTLWDEPPVLSLHHPDPFLFLLQKMTRHLLAQEQANEQIRKELVNRVKSLRREPQLSIVPGSSQHAFAKEYLPRPSA